MTGQTIRIVGCGLGDDTYQVDPRINPEAPTWNITKIQRDADAGRFGSVFTWELATLPVMGPTEESNIDWDKVRQIANDWSWMNKPVLHLLTPIGENLHRLIVDGNHRICARQAKALNHYQSFVVPPWLEHEYRIRAYDDAGKEIPLPY